MGQSSKHGGRPPKPELLSRNQFPITPSTKVEHFVQRTRGAFRTFESFFLASTGKLYNGSPQLSPLYLSLLHAAAYSFRWHSTRQDGLYNERALGVPEDESQALRFRDTLHKMESFENSV